MPPRTRLAIAFIAACSAATAAYALLRVAQYLIFTEPNPALVIYSEHAAYFWRSWLAAYFGVAVGFASWLTPERVLRHLPRAIVIAASLLVLQVVFVP